MRYGDMLGDILEKMRDGRIADVDIEAVKRTFNQLSDDILKVETWLQPGSDDPYFERVWSRWMGFMDGAAGMQIANPPLSYDGELWNLVGTDSSDTLQVGIRASDGKLLAAGGGVTMDENGLTVEGNSTTPYLSFKTGTTTVATVFQDGAGNLQFDLAIPNQIFTFNDGAVISGAHGSYNPAFGLHHAWQAKAHLYWNASDGHLSLRNNSGGNTIMVMEGTSTQSFVVWDLTNNINRFRLMNDGSFHVYKTASNPAYVDGFALIYFYSDGAGVDELRVRGKIGATETQVTLANITP